ncbi:unnamed protein product, partial [Hapterophycus canaliculatus]
MPLSGNAGTALVDASSVWAKLQEAKLLRDHCADPPCVKGKHLHTGSTDMAEEMSHVQGAVVVRRPDLAKFSGMVAPANSLDFAKTLQSYFGLFQRILFPISSAEEVVLQAERKREQPFRPWSLTCFYAMFVSSSGWYCLFRTFLDGESLSQVQGIKRFLHAVADGNSTAGRYLCPSYVDGETSKGASEGYEDAPVLVGMADVVVNELGYIWNQKARRSPKDMIVPKSCGTERFGPLASMAIPTTAKTYDKVFVIAQHWGDGYFHFLVEDLPRITLMLDILRENPGIKIAVHAPAAAKKGRKEYMSQFLELLGMQKERVIFLQKEGKIHADLAILPTSTACGKPNTQMIGMLRHALLLALYPDTSGAPPPVERSIILLVVRQTGRGLANSGNISKALTEEFPSYDVVEFLGTGPVASQLELFATASLIVAPHGAGLSNIMVSPLHTPVLEIGPPECSSCYIHLAVKV